MTTPNVREVSFINNARARALPDEAIETMPPPTDQTALFQMGQQLATSLCQRLSGNAKCLLVSSAEDADYLGKGVWETLNQTHRVKTAVFWNHYYRLQNGVSVAPVVHKFLEQGYQQTNELVVVKPVASGSCLLRTHILEVIEQVQVKHIYILSPVMFSQSERALRKELPDRISRKFRFLTLLCDPPQEGEKVLMEYAGGLHAYHKACFTRRTLAVNHIPDLVKHLSASSRHPQGGTAPGH